jgi:hypothetical protein
MLENRLDRIGVYSILTLSIGSLFTIILLWQKLPPQIPLFYSQPWGQDQLGNPWMLFGGPAASLILLMISLSATKLLKIEPLLTKIIIWTIALFSFLAFFTMIKIILLVI